MKNNVMLILFSCSIFAAANFAMEGTGGIDTSPASNGDDDTNYQSDDNTDDQSDDDYNSTVPHKTVMFCAKKEGITNLRAIIRANGKRTPEDVSEWGRWEFDSLLTYAATNNDVKLAKFAKKMADQIGQQRDTFDNGFDAMLLAATTAGHMGLAELAEKWGARDFYNMRLIALKQMRATLNTPKYDIYDSLKYHAELWGMGRMGAGDFWWINGNYKWDIEQ